MGLGFVGGAPFFNDAVAGTKVEVKAATTRLHALHVANTTAAVAYVQVFDKPAADVTVGSTPPLFAVRIPASAARELVFPWPVDLAEGFTLAGTTTATGNTGAAVSVIAVHE